MAAPAITAPAIALPGTVWIAADMHLRPESEATCEAFVAFLGAAAESCDALLLPGDIFDAWIGDDVLAVAPPWLARVVAALADTGARTALWIGHGNRDFLMGEAFAAAINARMLPSQARLETDFGPVLLLHGDELCTDDAAYQQMRSVVRSPAWQADILARPLPERMQIAASLREQSETGKAGKALEIMDVNQDAVQAVLRECGIARLVHGHTHRPDRHVFLVDGKPAERWVLPDWDLEASPPRGGWISIDRDGIAFNDIEAA